MQKWEYTRLIVNGTVVAFADGSNAATSPTAFVDALNQLGAEGWEVVGVPGNADRYTVLLKRPKQ